MKIEEIEEQLRNVFVDWEDLLVNPRFCRNNNVVCWTGYKGDGKAKEPVSREQLLMLIENGQYSFQSLEDGSPFSLYIAFQQTDY